ncbi:nitroreductase family protein [Shinella sp.]|uniref:nitroreductase family protein n=1 Tax=Shinella sp. TaxID=1870904 RepID=UPI00403735F4
MRYHRANGWCRTARADAEAPFRQTLHGGPLPPGTLEMLMAAGQSAATSSNMQTVSVIAATDPEKKTRLAKTCAGQDFIANAPVLLCFVTDLARPARVASTIGADLFALPMIDTFLASISDCSIFAQNLVLAAESLGMGTCYVGSLRNRPDLVAQELNVPNGSAVLFGLCIGYESRERVTAVRPRLPQRAILHRESYNTDGEDEALAEYDAIYAAAEKAQNRPVVSWREKHRDRFASWGYLDGRERMKKVLRSLGIPLA